MPWCRTKNGALRNSSISWIFLWRLSFGVAWKCQNLKRMHHSSLFSLGSLVDLIITAATTKTINSPNLVQGFPYWGIEESPPPPPPPPQPNPAPPPPLTSQKCAHSPPRHLGKFPPSGLPQPNLYSPHWITIFKL